MSDYYYLKTIPKETYQKILKLLEPPDLLRICETNKYAQNICDNNFYREYIKKKYNPSYFGFDKWDNNIFNNKTFIFNNNPTTWNDILWIIFQYNFIPLFDNDEHISYVAIHRNDSFNSIRDKLRHFNYRSFEIYGETVFGYFIATIKKVDFLPIDLTYTRDEDKLTDEMCDINPKSHYISESIILPNYSYRFDRTSVIGTTKLKQLFCKLKVDIPDPNIFDSIVEISI